MESVAETPAATLGGAIDAAAGAPLAPPLYPIRGGSDEMPFPLSASSMLRLAACDFACAALRASSLSLAAGELPALLPPVNGIEPPCSVCHITTTSLSESRDTTKCFRLSDCAV